MKFKFVSISSIDYSGQQHMILLKLYTQILKKKIFILRNRHFALLIQLKEYINRKGPLRKMLTLLYFEPFLIFLQST